MPDNMKHDKKFIPCSGDFILESFHTLGIPYSGFLQIFQTAMDATEALLLTQKSSSTHTFQTCVAQTFAYM